MLSVAPPLARLLNTWSIIDSAVLGAATAAIAYFMYLQFAVDSIPTYSLYLPFLTQWKFFANRSDLLASAFKKVQAPILRLKIIGYPVIVTSSHQARAFFFGSKNLSFTEGYKILLGGVPRLEEINVKTEHLGTDDTSWFQTRITHLLRKERLSEMLPIFISDMDKQVKGWGNEGILNPFVDIYNVIFQITARAALCNEVADNPKTVARVRVLYERIERAADAKSHVFPWLPNSAIKSKNDATRELYTLLSDIIDEKKKRDTTEHDTIQSMIDLGDGVSDIVGFALGTLFAGVLNTTNVACWIPLFLDANPEWKAKVLSEIRGFLGMNSIDLDTVATRMIQVPASAWEEELPVIDLVIRETIRLMVTGTAMRRNLSKDVKVDGKIVERGAFLLYPITAVHFDPEVYVNPYRFDPGRFEMGREEDRKVQFGYLGWGVGRHPCLGMRFAKLELKLITVYLLAAFEFIHTDKMGNRKSADADSVDRNLVFQVLPKDRESFLKYHRTAL